MTPGPGVTVVRARLPTQLRDLAGVGGEVELETLEAQFPVLKGTIRDRATGKRRAFIRFFVGEADLSNVSPDAALPEAVARGQEALVVVGAMAGG